MRSFVWAAAAGLAVGLLVTPRAEAMTTTAPAGARVAAQELDTTEAVHCRRYAHQHRYGWSRGCGRVGVVVVPSRGYVVRDGVRVRVGSGGRHGVSTRTTVRTRTDTNIRSGEGNRGGSREGMSGGREGGQGGRQTTGGSGPRQGSGQGGQGSQPQQSGGGGSGGGQQR